MAGCVLSRAFGLLGARVGVVSLFIAAEADDSRVVQGIARELTLDLLDALRRYHLLLAVGRFVTHSSAPIADNVLVHGGPRREPNLRHIDKLAVHPVLLGWKICQLFQGQVLRSNHALDVHILALGAFLTEAEGVI